MRAGYKLPSGLYDGKHKRIRSHVFMLIELTFQDYTKDRKIFHVLKILFHI